ncbi:MAG: hypothetical protein DI628_06910 [Blastochloris viridis]|uniref:Uncharacterized protein n=1 Tax=Blastochloris viridis TaxID=1079 RepID=A0A6N4RC51_BLAVI|nr:MAG: hypothetical protein DI628_06910 [Blastochloris viridis]
MANRTVIIKQNQPSDDETSLWVILLVAFAVAMIAIVGYKAIPSRTTEAAPAAVTTQQQPAAAPAATN